MEIPPAIADENIRPIFPSRVTRLALTRRRNLPESIPPSGKIRQGPVLSALDKPKLAVKRDVAKVTAKRLPSEPISAVNGDSLSRFSPSRNRAKIAMNVKMAVAGMAS